MNKVTTKHLPNKTSPNSSLKEFWLGLTQPSSIAISICFSLMLIAIVSYALLANPDLVAKRYDYLAQNFKDSYAKLTGDTLLLSFSEEKSSSFQVVLLGASAIREGLDNDEIIASTLTKQTNESIEVISLLSSGQTVWESIAVLEKISHQIHGLVWIEVNPLRMSRGKMSLQNIIQQPRLGFISKKIDDYAQQYEIDVPARLRWYGWDNRGFLLVRTPNLLSNLSTGPIQFQRHRFDNKSAMTKVQLDKQASSIKAELTNYDEEAEIVLNLIAELIALKNKNFQIALLESPVNPKFVNDIVGLDFYNKHWSRMRNFSKQNDIPYLRFAAGTATQSEHFYDWFHIFDPKIRTKLSEGFAKVSTQILQNSISLKINP